ncbi:MAG: hypothetical protein ABGZ23_07725 [Fuerstiella sp.]
MAERYFLKRGETVKGPFSIKKLQKLLAAKKLKANDLIGANESGPWKRMAAAHKAIQAGQPLSLPRYEATAVEEPPVAAEQSSEAELTLCEDCGKQISKRVVSCPHCGIAVENEPAEGVTTLPKTAFECRCFSCDAIFESDTPDASECRECAAELSNDTDDAPLSVADEPDTEGIEPVQAAIPDRLTAKADAVAPSPAESTPKTLACTDCGGTVSRRADQCPHCGAPLASGPPTGTATVQPVNVIDNEEALKNPVIIQTFDTKGKLTLIDNILKLYDDEAECRIKFNATGEYHIAAGPVRCDERGFEYFLNGEYGVNRVHGTAGEAFNVKVVFLHRNWSGLYVKVKAYQNVGDIPVCERPDSEVTLTYAGVKPGVSLGRIPVMKPKIRLVMTNSIDTIHGEWVKLQAVSSLTFGRGLSNYDVQCDVQSRNGHPTFGLSGKSEPSPFPIKRTIHCTNCNWAGICSFVISSPEVDKSHPSVIYVDGEYRFANLTILSGP